MKIPTLGALTFVGMAVVGTTVYAVTPTGGFGASVRRSSANVASSELDQREVKPIDQAVQTSKVDKSQFSVGSTLKVEGRLGHSTMPATGSHDTFVLLEVGGDKLANTQPPRVDLSIVIDKSGSMTGTRLPNALRAAEIAVNKLRDGDSVSIIAFDTKIETMLPQTRMTSVSRIQAIEAIKKIHLGGDTCISCGIEEGVAQLGTASTFAASAGNSNLSNATSLSTARDLKRVLLLSDGAPTAGMREPDAFRRLAEGAMGKGISITTIGVDVDYNEVVMTAIATGSNGHHYFVENDQDLARTFEAEAASLEDSVASDAVAEIDLAPGVELVQLFDRTFERRGSRVSVPIGTLAKGESMTVLMKVRVPIDSKTADGTTVRVADVRVSFHDWVLGKDTVQSGELELTVADARNGDLDGVVSDRVQKSETAAALNEANTLFNLGKADKAKERLEQARVGLTANKAKASTNAPMSRKADVDRSFDAQEAELNRASGALGPSPTTKAPASKPGAPAPRPAPAPPPREQKSHAKRNADSAFDMMR